MAPASGVQTPSPHGVPIIGTENTPKSGQGSALASAALNAPLRHSFSLTPSPYAVPYSCYDGPGGYYCRGLYGYEEGGSGGGYDQDYLVEGSIVARASDFGDYWREVITIYSDEYQGCGVYDQDTFICDYFTPGGSTRVFASGDGYWVKVLKDWGTYRWEVQVGCATTITASWVGAADLSEIVNSCLTEPYSVP